jgi:quinoprotein glucose dehydrogenase
MTSFRCLLSVATILGLVHVASAQDNTWQTFNGDLKAQKYSGLTQITPENV